jgi:peptidyl-dipeptidase A
VRSPTIPPTLEAPTSGRPITETLRGIERRLAHFDHTISLTEWRLYAGRSKRDAEPWINARARFLRQERLHRWVERARSQADEGGALARRLELLNRDCLDAASEQHPSVVRIRSLLQRRILAFRPRFRGRRVDRALVNDELRDNPNAELREEAYRAEDELWHRIEPEFLNLVRARNARARALGYPNFPALRLGFEGLRVKELQSLCDSAVRPLAGKIREIRDEFLASTLQGAWFPWDLRYAQERRAPLPKKAFPGNTLFPAVRAALRKWGLPMGQLPIRFDQHDLPWGGLTFPVRIPRDIRILMPSKGGWERYLVCFHEMGHAVHFASIRQRDYLLQAPDVGYAGLCEGIGDLFEEISLDADWLRGRRGIDRQAVGKFRTGRALEHLVRAATMAEWVATELDLYLHPTVDPTPRSVARFRAVFGFDRYLPRSFLRTAYVTHPVYSQSYLLSLLFRKQMVRAISDQVGGPLWPNPAVGPWLEENWFESGAQYDWIPHVLEVTGRSFGVQAFQESVRSGEP